jgi:Flp pilus assembly protein TadB
MQDSDTAGAAGPSFGDRLKAGREEARALGSEAAAIAQDLRRLLQLERQLAKAEANEAKGYATRGAGFGTAAAVLLFLFLFFLFMALMFALDTAMALWLAALITAGIILLLAAILGMLARSQMQRFSPVPRRLVSNIQEDVRWAQSQASRMRSIRR